jgi:hypothetical protein
MVELALMGWHQIALPAYGTVGIGRWAPRLEPCSAAPITRP